MFSTLDAYPPHIHSYTTDNLYYVNSLPQGTTLNRYACGVTEVKWCILRQCGVVDPVDGVSIGITIRNGSYLCGSRAPVPGGWGSRLR